MDQYVSGLAMQVRMKRKAPLILLHLLIEVYVLPKQDICTLELLGHFYIGLTHKRIDNNKSKTLSDSVISNAIIGGFGKPPYLNRVKSSAARSPCRAPLIIHIIELSIDYLRDYSYDVGIHPGKENNSV